MTQAEEFIEEWGKWFSFKADHFLHCHSVCVSCDKTVQRIFTDGSRVVVDNSNREYKLYT